MSGIDMTGARLIRVYQNGDIDKFKAGIPCRSEVAVEGRVVLQNEGIVSLLLKKSDLNTLNFLIDRWSPLKFHSDLVSAVMKQLDSILSNDGSAEAEKFQWLNLALKIERFSGVDKLRSQLLSSDFFIDDLKQLPELLMVLDVCNVDMNFLPQDRLLNFLKQLIALKIKKPVLLANLINSIKNPLDRSLLQDLTAIASTSSTKGDVLWGSLFQAYKKLRSKNTGMFAGAFRSNKAEKLRFADALIAFYDGQKNVPNPLKELERIRIKAERVSSDGLLGLIADSYKKWLTKNVDPAALVGEKRDPAACTDKHCGGGGGGGGGGGDGGGGDGGGDRTFGMG